MAKRARKQDSTKNAILDVAERMARDGATVDRGTMSRWLEQLGGVLGATVVEAMDRDARARAFCILTDATGFAIQPGRFDDPKQRKRRPCRKGQRAPFYQLASGRQFTPASGFPSGGRWASIRVTRVYAPPRRSSISLS